MPPPIAAEKKGTMGANEKWGKGMEPWLTELRAVAESCRDEQWKRMLTTLHQQL